jgi:signal transduction histidine kinase
MNIELVRAGPRVPPAARPAIVGAALVWALVAEAIRVAAGWPPVWVIGDLIPGVVFVACGHVAWRRTPGSRIGPLMVAIGVAWYAGTAAASGVHAVDRIAHAFQGYYDPLLAWLILAYPSGRLERRSSQVVVGVFLLVLAARTVFRLLVFPVTGDLDVADPLAVDRYVAEVTLREAGATVFRAVIAVLAVAVLILTLGRWRSETAAGRAIAGPILLGGFAFAIGVVIETLALFGSRSFSDRVVAWDVGQWVTVVTASLIPIGFLIGLGQDRLARGRVADLVVGLGDAVPDRGDLQATLRETLRDPSLVVAYAVGSAGRFVDVDGAAIELPDGAADRAVTRVDRSDRTIAALIHDPALTGRPDLVTSVAAATGLVLENEALQAELRVQLAEVRASRARIVAAGDAERRRVERDLHDGAQQRFVTLALALQMARARVPDDTPELAEMLDHASDELERGLAELRELARGIHPTVLTEDGLAAAIGALAERSAVPTSIAIPDRRFDPAVEATAYYVVAEALTNIARYAGDTTASVSLTHDGSTLRVEIHDEGPGGAVASRGSGLQGLGDRVAAVGGTFLVDSPAGAGTTIRAAIPCA